MMLTLLEAGADVNFVSHAGKTALITAATKANLDAVQTLLARE
jgi:ankyrin repeat protein